MLPCCFPASAIFFRSEAIHVPAKERPTTFGIGLYVSIIISTTPISSKPLAPQQHVAYRLLGVTKCCFSCNLRYKEWPHLRPLEPLSPIPPWNPRLWRTSGTISPRFNIFYRPPSDQQPYSYNAVFWIAMSSARLPYGTAILPAVSLVCMKLADQ